MSELPSSWVETHISEVAEVNPRKEVNLQDADLVTFVPMAAVDEISGTIVSAVDRPYGEVSKGFTHFRDNDVIFAKITPSMENGKSAVALGLTNGTGVGSTEFHVFRPSEAIEANYLWRFIRQRSFRADAQAVMSGAVGQQRVPADYLKKHLIPLPPRSEQCRIVAKVDALTVRTARARKELDSVPALVARYKQRLLALAFSGELTAGWRFIKTLAPPQTKSLAHLCLTITDGDHQAPPRADSGIPFVTISAMNDGQIDLSKAVRFVPKSYFEGLKESRRAKAGDVLFSVTGSIGISALVKDNTPFVFQRHIAILKPDPQHISGAFLKFMLESPEVKAQCVAVATGTAQLTIPLGGLREFVIPLPTRSEQAEIVRRIESAFDWLDRVGADYAAAARLLPKLEAAILDRAFRGELVPQDPKDEPASVLLSRISAERDQRPHKVQAKRPSTTALEESPMAIAKTMQQVLTEAGDWVPAQTAFQRCGVSNQAPTEEIEKLYAELRDLDSAGRLETEAVTDDRGRKRFDQLRLKAA